LMTVAEEGISRNYLKGVDMTLKSLFLIIMHFIRENVAVTNALQLKDRPTSR